MVVLLSAADYRSLSRSVPSECKHCGHWGEAESPFLHQESDGLAWTVHHGSVKKHGALLLCEVGVGETTATALCGDC